MKNKKIKQLFALVMASALCLTACGNEQSSSLTSTSENTNSSASVSEESQQPEVKNYWEMLNEVSDSSELPDWTGEKLVVNIWNAGGTDAVWGTLSDNNVVMKEIERVTGVVIDVDNCFGNGGDNIDAKLPKLIASKDFPTIIYGWDIDKVLNDLWENGYLADLTEYYMDGTLDHMLHWLPLEEFEECLYTYLKDEDGKYFALPKVNVGSYLLTAGYNPEGFDAEYFKKYSSTPGDQTNINYTQAFAIRDDILKAMYPDAHTREELDEIYLENGSFTREQIYDIPLKSPEDAIDFLYEVQAFLEENEFVGIDGKRVETTYGPHTGTDNWGWMYFLPTLVREYPRCDYFSVAEVNNEDDLLIEWAINSEPTIEWMKTLNKLVNDNVIIKDSLVDNQATYDEKIKNGHYAVTYGMNAMNIHKDQDVDWTYRPIWVDYDAYTQYYYFKGMSQRYNYAVFKDSVPEDQMDQLMHYFDYMSSEVGVNVMLWGPASAGLFEEDAEGNRSFVNEELHDAMINQIDSKLPMEYGLMSDGMSEEAFEMYLGCGIDGFLKPRFLVTSELPRDNTQTLRYFTPGTLPGEHVDENAYQCKVDQLVYSLGQSVDGLKTFWAARTGFENQLKKVIVAGTEAEFDSQLKVLRQYAEENGLTDETLKEYNDLFVEKNYDLLKKQGIIE